MGLVDIVNLAFFSHSSFPSRLSVMSFFHVIFLCMRIVGFGLHLFDVGGVFIGIPSTIKIDTKQGDKELCQPLLPLLLAHLLHNNNIKKKYQCIPVSLYLYFILLSTELIYFASCF